MALIKLSCDVTDVAAHTCNPCDDVENGRVRSVVLGKASKYANAAAFKTAISAAQSLTNAIEQGDVVVIPRTTGTHDGGSPNTGDGYGDEDDRVLSYTHNVAFSDPSYKGNSDFWEAAEQSAWYLAFRTETLLHVAPVPVRLQAIDPVEADLTSDVTWDVTATWKTSKKNSHIALEENTELASAIESCWGEE